MMMKVCGALLQFGESLVGTTAKQIPIRKHRGERQSQEMHNKNNRLQSANEDQDKSVFGQRIHTVESPVTEQGSRGESLS
jgi:hypothetical protein